MAKKQKRSNYQAPAKTKGAAQAAAAKADAAADELKDGVASTGAAASGAAAKAGAGAKKASASGAKAQAGASAAAKDQAKKAAPTRGRGMSANMQWALLIGGICAVLAIVLGISVLNNGGGTGVLTVDSWDVPARADDTDNGDDDGRIKLADFTGTPTVVNFFASWCETCDRELPYFTAIGDTYRDQFDMVFVNGNEDTGEWRTMADRHDIVGRFPVARDIKGTNRNGLLRELGGNTGMPATVFYDAQGNFVKFTNGVVDEPTLRSELAALGVEL